MSFLLYAVTGITKTASNWVDMFSRHHGIDGNEMNDECAVIRSSLEETMASNDVLWLCDQMI